MPVLRVNKEQYSYVPTGVQKKVVRGLESSIANHEIADLAICDVKYPLDTAERELFRTQTGKRVTDHQWEVYDYARMIPCGKVTTYKDVCLAIGKGSPRSVGNALRNNPFAPRVPCHRIIASNFFVGGFFGEWSKTGIQCNRKIDMLRQEGVSFDKNGYLIGGNSVVWRS